jgi:hypothetical protein
MSEKLRMTAVFCKNYFSRVKLFHTETIHTVIYKPMMLTAKHAKSLKMLVHLLVSVTFPHFMQ